MRAILLILALAVTGCGVAKGSGTVVAEQIPGPSGYDCFAIYQGDDVVAGNCVPE